MNATVMCEKCGKPLGMFDGNICNECETERSRQMPHSLRAKLSGLHYKGILEDKDYKRLCKALDNEKVLEQVRAEIEELDRYYDNDYFSVNNCPMYKCNEVLLIIDKYKGDKE